MMKVRNGFTNWRPWIGVLAVGVLAFGISLEGATPTKVSSESSVSREKIRTVEKLQITETVISQFSNQLTSRAAAGIPSRVVFSQMPVNMANIPIAETVVVNPYNDIGDKWRLETGNTGPMPTLRELRMSRVGVAAGECSFAIECEDGDPCTENSCNIVAGAPAGSGKCLSTGTPDGVAGDCDDGVFCNGEETCQGGSCGYGTGDDVPCPDQECSESLSRANFVAGELTAFCHDTCANDSECTSFPTGDILECDGSETCVSGVCEAGTNPCGAGADCAERVCENCGPGCNFQRACSEDADCISDDGLQVGACDGGRTCFVGRCCTTTDDGVTYDCLAKKLGGAQACTGLWYAGDGGRLTNACGSSSGGCPKYGSGIAPNGDFVRLVGPISGSPVAINAPAGPGVALHKMGDDYTLSNDPSFLNLQYVRLVGGMLEPDRLSVEIYDENQNFVQDFFFSISDDIIAVRTVEFEPPIVIPSKGYLVTRIASRFSFEAKWVWMTTDAVDVGSNDSGVIWVNDGPTTSFLGTEVMAFELVGKGDPDNGGDDKVSAPVGACCNGDTGACNDLLAWECRGNEDNFVGLSTTCASCGSDSVLLGSPCRTCDSGANVGDPCINDGECDGGLCELNDSVCSFCDLNSSNVGDPCSVDGDCTGGLCVGTCEPISNCSTGSCCELDGTCESGTYSVGHAQEGQAITPATCAGGICRLGDNDGSACTVVSDCYVCDSLSSNAGAPCPGGDGECTPTTGLCVTDVCDNFSTNAGSSCTEDTECTAINPGSCVGGLCDAHSTNADAVCTVDSECTAINLGLCASNACNSTSANVGATCTDDIECTDTGGFCVNDEAITCETRFQGFGLDCNPNCCYQPQDKYRDPLGDLNGDEVADGPWSGGDSCEDAFVHMVTVPSPGPDSLTVITITGDNSNATNSFDSPDTCIGFSEDPEADRGWWESFSIDSCAFIWWDVCCTTCEGGCQPGPVTMYDSCDPDAGGCPTSVIAKVNPNEGQPDRFVRGLSTVPSDNFQGCEAADNITMFFGPLVAGTYYIPFLATLQSVNGPYQMHITISPCPVAACCTTNAGNTASDCTLANILDCEGNGGYFHAPPRRATAIIVCDNDPEDGTCATGSCCSGPGLCDDNDGVGDPFTIDSCNTEGGKYVGGVPCAGGFCSADPSISCNDDDDCDLDGPCKGDLADLAQPNPCPVCEFQGLNNCQLFDNINFTFLPSDFGMPGALTLADDFVPGGPSISKVCIWGFYLRAADPAAGGSVDPDCDDDIGGQDNFRVTIYENGSNDLPGAVVGSSISTVYVKTPLEVETPLSGIDAGPVDTYGVQMILDSAITGMINDGRAYWIEVANDLSDFDDCNWWWWQLNEGSALGNNYGASALGSEYVAGSEIRSDMTFCLEDDFTLPASPVRACCTCVDGLCEEMTLFDCNAVRGKWHNEANTCGGVNCMDELGAPANDDCVNYEVVTSVPFRANTNTFCATTDGYNPILTDFGTDALGSEVWFAYTPTEDCVLTASQCASGVSYDSMLALYSDGTGTCKCVADVFDLATHLETFIEGSDESCTIVAIEAGGIITHQALAGVCYLVRAGGWAPGGATSQGIGIVDITCVGEGGAPTPVLPDSYSPGALACGGGDNYGLACEACDAGSRAGMTCLTSGDCPSGICKSNDALCPGATCGGAIAGGGTTFPYPKSRFIGFEAGTDETWVGKENAIRVTFDSIGPNPSCNGQIRYAGTPAQFCEGGACDVMFWASKLQADPHWMDWTTVGSVQLYGVEVVSDSRYSIQAISFLDAGSLGDDAKYSTPALLVNTAKWGDVVIPLSGFTSAAQPSISDVLQLVDKWLGNLEPRKSRTLLQPGTLNVSSSVGIADVLRGVDAWLGTPYPFTITTCP